MRSLKIAGIATMAAVVGVVGLGATSAFADQGTVKSSSVAATTSADGFTFTELQDPKDVTFNQTLGINGNGTIAGYFGAGTSATVHPNRGYVLNASLSQSGYLDANFPGSAQTQVIGINNAGATAGFFANAAGETWGFVRRDPTLDRVYMVAQDPAGGNDDNQLLGLNNNGMAVGFYTDGAGNNHAYRFDFHTDQYSAITIPGATTVTASGINYAGDITGFYQSKTSGGVKSFRLVGSTLSEFGASNSGNTTAFGINDNGEIVGSYVLGTGAAAKTFGFTRSSAGVMATVTDPAGIDSTVINGVNDSGSIVGFYTATNGDTDGFIGRK